MKTRSPPDEGDEVEKESSPGVLELPCNSYDAEECEKEDTFLLAKLFVNFNRKK